MPIPLEPGPRGPSQRPNGVVCLEDKFEIIKDDIGDGSFGSVALARVRAAGAHVARRGTLVAIKTMKKTFDSFAPCLELREVVFLRTLPNHAHLVPALDIFLDPISKRLHICMEHMDGNLYQLMKARDHKCLDTVSVKSILFQILSGLEHIHAHNFFHRDIKPENILVSTSAPQDPATTFRRYSTLSTPPPTPPTYTVKIADFGLARETHSRLPYTTYVSTRWYRAPEVLLRAGGYSAPVDIWAIGAMAVEIATLKPLFPGSNEVDQVWRVCEIMGSPGNWYSRRGGKVGGGDWADGTRLAQKLGFSFPKMAPHSMETILQPPQWPSSLSEFVTWCLMWDPKNRPTSTQALRHEYFADAIDPLRPKSSASRILGRKQSDLGYKAKDYPESPRTLNSKSSWFRRSLIGRDAFVATSQHAAENKPESPRPAPVHSSTVANVSAKVKPRPEAEKRFTWTNGLGPSNAAPMPILPTIRPISPLSDAVTAQANGRGSNGTQSGDKDDDGRRHIVLEDKSAKKVGRQLSVASNSNHYADIHWQEAERALNGHGGLISPPSGHKESFFSHLRKRARRLSGRNQLAFSPMSDDVEANAGCSPWSSNRSSMAVDHSLATVPTLDFADHRELEKAHQIITSSVDVSSSSSQGYGQSGLKSKGPSSLESRNNKILRSLAHEQATRSTEISTAATTGAGPVSSRTRRGLQKSTHAAHMYETPDEQEELLDEIIQTAQTAVRQLDRKKKVEAQEGQRGRVYQDSKYSPLRHPAGDVGLSNPYPTPSPSANPESAFSGRTESASQASPIDIRKSSYHKEPTLSKWPTPPYEENEWAAAAAASIYAAGAAYR